MKDIEQEYEETIQQIADLSGLNVEKIKETIDSVEDIDELLIKASELLEI
jgi:hypothetical protein